MNPNSSLSPAVVAEYLAELTGDLAVAPERAQELEQARRLLARSFVTTYLPPVTKKRSGEPRAALPDLRLIAAEMLLSEPAADRVVRVERRELPGTPSGASRTLGPFVTLQRARRVWFDVFEAPSEPHTIVSGADVVLVFTGTLTTSDGLVFDLPAGGVWIHANVFGGSFPTGRYAGLRVTGGTITFGAPPFARGAELVLAPLTTTKVELSLDQSGGDQFIPPSKITLEFQGEFLASLTTDDPARVSAYGAAAAMTPKLPALPVDGRLHLPTDATVSTANATAGESIFELRGDWKLDAVAWEFALEPLDPTRPTVPDESGFAHAQAGGGLTLSWPGASSPLILDAGEITAHSARVELIVSPNRAAVRQTLRDEAGSLAEIRFSAAEPLTLLRIVFADGIFTRIQTRANIDMSLPRPVSADGKPLDVRARGAFVLTEQPGLVSIALSILNAPQSDVAFALSNAVLKASGPLEAHLDAQLGPDGTATTVAANFMYRLQGVLPALPDPYAANFDPQPRAGTDAEFVVGASWSSPDEPQVFFDLARIPDPAAALLGWMPDALQDSLNFDGSRFPRREVASSINRESVSHWMLDVSTNSGQFGIALGRRGSIARAAVEDSTLSWDGLDVLCFSVPSIQWEPVSDSTGLMLSIDDGGPSALSVDTVHLVPVTPVEAARRLIDEYTDGAVGQAAFTLPFGIRARIRSGDPNGAGVLANRAKLALEEPAFGDLRAALQVRVESANTSGMPGFAVQTDNVSDLGRDDTNVLSISADAVRQQFDNTFGGLAGSVPLERYDWSGHGASVFSKWVNPKQEPPNVSQVRFDVLNGRTSHEVIQVSGILWPCRAFVVRTITMERENRGVVVRHDSGWVASSDGRFTDGAGIKFHRGLTGGYTNIREIRDTETFLEPSAGAKLQQVFFDADLEVPDAVKGNRGITVPVQRHTGYVQFEPSNIPLSPAQLFDLFQKVGPIGGPVDCEIAAGATGTRVLISSLLCEPAIRPPGAPEFVVSLNGMPKFPKSGSWTAVRTRQGQTTPVDPVRGLPLIREGALPVRFADPADLLRTPETQYGFLFSTGSSRVLLPEPQYADGAREISSPSRARMADPYAMATANGLFPNNGASLEFPGPYALDLGAADILNQQAAKRPGELELASNDIMRLYVEASSTFDAVVKAVDWNTKSIDQTLFLDLFGAKKILSIRGKWAADSLGNQKFNGAAVELGKQLDAVSDIVDILKSLGLPASLDFSLRTEGGDTLALEVSVQGFISQPNGERVDTGFGKLRGSIRTGIIIRASISRGIQGFAYFEIGGDLQQAIIPGLLYAGGFIRFKIGVFDNGDTQPELTAGTVGSLGGDLIKGLIEVEGTVKYGYQMVVPHGDFSLTRLGATLGMEVRATLLSGLVGVKFGWEGGALIGLSADQSEMIITAHVSASASLTAAWVFKTSTSVELEYEATVPRKLVQTVAVLLTYGVGPAAVSAAVG